MKLEDQVCSLSLAKRLKELGVKQESFLGWMLVPLKRRKEEDEHELMPFGGNLTKDQGYSAFTVAEMGEMLPQNVEGKDLESRRYESGQWRVWYQPRVNSSTDIFAVSKTEADARASMLIYLIENKLVTP